METSVCRLATKKQSLDDMYSVPANFLEIDVINPSTTIIAGKKKFTDYEIRMRVSEMNPRKEREEKKKCFDVFVPHIPISIAFFIRPLHWPRRLVY